MKKLFRYAVFSTLLCTASFITVPHSQSSGLSASEFENDFNNPFYDAFTLYYYKKNREAKRALLNLTSQERYALHAHINYGYVAERERDFNEAEKSYKMARQRGGFISLVYLIGLYGKTGSHSVLETYDWCESASPRDNSYWVDYQRSVFFLMNKNTQKGLFHLVRAVENGFAEHGLLTADPAFREVSHEAAFKTIVAAARQNRIRRMSHRKALEQDEDDHLKNKPFGLSKDLRSILAGGPAAVMREEDALKRMRAQAKEVRDRAVITYWLARIRAARRDSSGAKQHLREFDAILDSGEKDATGFVKLVRKYRADLVSNDPFLKAVGVR